MCELNAYESTFKSVEHAFFWRMCTEMGENDLSARIKKSRHAGEAKRLSKEIEDEKRYAWEENNVEVM